MKYESKDGLVWDNVIEPKRLYSFGTPLQESRRLQSLLFDTQVFYIPVNEENRGAQIFKNGEYKLPNRAHQLPQWPKKGLREQAPG